MMYDRAITDCVDNNGSNEAAFQVNSSPLEKMVEYSIFKFLVDLK